MFEDADPNEALLLVNPYDQSVATMRRAQTNSKKKLNDRKKYYERVSKS